MTPTDRQTTISVAYIAAIVIVLVTGAQVIAGWFGV